MFWNKIKHHSVPNFKRLTGVELKTFKVMVREVKKHDSKKAEKKGNKRSRPFHLSNEDQVQNNSIFQRCLYNWAISVAFNSKLVVKKTRNLSFSSS